MKTITKVTKKKTKKTNKIGLSITSQQKKTLNILLLAGIIVLLLVYIGSIQKFPYTWVDEGWAAEPAYNLVYHHSFTMPSQTGWAGQEIATYSWPPFTYLAIASSYLLFGFGIVQTRLVSHVALLALLFFSYLFGKKITGKKETGLLTAFLLLVNHLVFYIFHSPRPDVFAGLFILLGTYEYYLWKQKPTRKNIFLSGLFFGLSVASHAIGAISAVGVGILLLVQKTNYTKKLQSLGWYILGGLLIALPYGAYILKHPKLFLLQLFGMHETTSASFLKEHLLREYVRYANTLHFYWHFFLLLFIIGIVALFLQKKTKELGYLAVLNIIGLAILLPNKSASQYLIAILPLATLGFVLLFDKQIIQKKFLRVGIYIVLAGCIITGLGAQTFIVYQHHSYQPYTVQESFLPIIQNASVIAPLTYYYYFPKQLISLDNIETQMKLFNKTPGYLAREFNATYIIIDSQNPEKTTPIQTFLETHTTKVKEIKEGYNISLYKIEEKT